ncbi:MAG: GerMN domain-containing protein, partial [Thermoleophilia bacterium]
MKIKKNTARARSAACRVGLPAARRSARPSLLLLAALIAAAGLVACGGNATPQPTATVTVTAPASASPSVSASPAPTPSATAVSTVSIYFLRPIGGTQPDHGPFIATAHRTVSATKAVAAAAMNALLGGPTAPEKGIRMSTVIPAGTTLRGLTIAHGVATVDLSGAFESGGGTLSMTGRLAQVVYTLTQFSSVSKGVLFEVDGKHVTVFGGEGIMLSHPQQRSDYESVTPPIFVESPAPFDTVDGTLRSSGTADVFEATFRAKLVGAPASGSGASGVIAGPITVTASSGSGTRGSFTFDLSPAGSGASGKLVVWDASAKDGSAL